MTPEQLAAWKKESIDGERLFTLTEDDLERIGVCSALSLPPWTHLTCYR